MKKDVTDCIAHYLTYQKVKLGIGNLEGYSSLHLFKYVNRNTSQRSSLWDFKKTTEQHDRF